LELSHDNLTILENQHFFNFLSDGLSLEGAIISLNHPDQNLQFILFKEHPATFDHQQLTNKL
jgi:hypothetical protein